MSPTSNWKAALTAITTGIGLLLTYYFHIIIESSYVFTHFFYLPIILATYWYGFRGMSVPFLLVAGLMVTNFFKLDSAELFSDSVRSSILIAVGFVIASMREVAWKTEMELELNRQQLNEAQRIASIGGWVWDIKEKRLSWTEEVFRIFKLDPAEYKPTFEGYFEFVPAEEQKPIRDAVEVVLNRGAPLDLDHHIVLRDGSIKIVHQRAEMICDDDEKPCKLMGIVQDVTQRKAIEEELLRANIKLNLMNSITRHDMRNMLTSIAGYLDLSKRTKVEEKREKYLEKGLTALGHLQDLIEEAKDYQEIGSREPAWNDIDSILNRYKKNVVEADRRLEVDVNGIEILADPIIEKVLYNLIDNSLRHAEGATVVRFRTEDHKTDVALICEDDGPGVLYEEKERIFEKGVGKNTGFGLFFVKEALSIAGISISEEGVYGNGVKFVMTVPSNKVRWNPEHRSN